MILRKGRKEMLIPSRSPGCFKPYTRPIVKLAATDLKPGKLEQLFLQGAKAVILENDPRVGQLCDWFWGEGDRESGKTQKEKMAWADNILDMGWNHQANNISSGDMLRFIPGGIGHIARKILIFPGTDEQHLQTIPEFFWKGNQQIRLPNQIIELAWDLMSDILRSSVTVNFDQNGHGVTINLLKYPESYKDFEKIWTLFADSSGEWTKIGQRIDSSKALAAGVFNTKGLRDLFAIASLIPWMGVFARKLKRSLVDKTNPKDSEDYQVIGGPHVDGSNWLVGLTSQRDSIITEIHDGAQWVELPLTPYTLAIFPGQKIKGKLSVKPTEHRILIKKNKLRNFQTNFTLNISIVDLPKTL